MTPEQAQEKARELRDRLEDTAWRLDYHPNPQVTIAEVRREADLIIAAALQSAAEEAYEQGRKDERQSWRLVTSKQKEVGTGACLNCGRKLTFCGEPFTADIACQRCGAVNAYENSQQPAAIRSRGKEE